MKKRFDKKQSLSKEKVIEEDTSEVENDQESVAQTPPKKDKAV